MLCQKAPVNSHSPRTYTYEDTEARRVQGIVRGIPPYRDMDAAVFCLSGKACRARREKGEGESGLLKRETETHFHRCKRPTFIVANNPTSRAGVPGQSGGLTLEQKTQTAARHAPVHTSWRLTHERILSQRWRQKIDRVYYNDGGRKPIDTTVSFDPQIHRDRQGVLRVCRSRTRLGGARKGQAATQA